MRQRVANRMRQFVRYYYPLTAANLVVAVTVIVALLIFGSPIDKCDC